MTHHNTALMRAYIYIVFTLSIALHACNATEAGDVQSNSDANEKTYIVQVKKDSVNHIYAWQGNLDGRYPVLMWYKEYGDVLTGSLFYTENKNARPIQLIGTIQNDVYRILEMWPDGDISGIWELRPDEHGAEGGWTSPTGDEHYSASLMRTDTAVSVPDIEIKNDISGTYVYSYGKTGALGHMTVSKKMSTATVAFDNVSAAPARNLAILDKTEFQLTGNTALYESTSFGPCAIRIRFYKGFAVVNYISDKDNCGFGHNAHVSGLYIKQ